KSPVKRTGRDRFVRNVLIAIGNSGDAALASEAERLLADASPLVRGAAVWALGRLLSRERLAEIAAAERPRERDTLVDDEWTAAPESQQKPPGRHSAQSAAFRSRFCGSAPSTARARTRLRGSSAGRYRASPSPGTWRTVSTYSISRRRSMPRSRGARTASSTS